MEKSKELQIYCLGYKPYDFVDDEYHTILHCGKELHPDVVISDICDNTGDNISKENEHYFELTGIYWLWKNMNDIKYVGHEQYRRRWQDKPENIIRLLDEHPLVLPYKLKMLPSIKGNFNSAHNAKAFASLEEVVKTNYPDLAEPWDKLITCGNTFYRCNSFIARKDIYDELCEFIFGAISGFRDKEGLYKPEDINDYVLKNSVHYLPGNHITKDKWGWETYQRALFAFMSERLITLYVQAKLTPFWTIEYKDLEKSI